MFSAIVRRGILTTVVLLIVCVLGMLAATRIPVQMIPDLDVRVISVRTIWPGATPQDVEKEILIEQEEYLRNLPYLSRIIATARSGRAEIELEFPFGVDITEMLIRVNNALSQVPSYPESVDEPRLYANSFSGNAFMFFSITPLPGNPRQLDIDLLLDFVEDNVKPRLAQVKGVSEVDINGGAERQVQILIDPARLAQRQLSLTDVREVIRSRNRDRSGGDVEAGKRQYLVRTIGRFESLEELRQLIIARRGDSVIYLQDVATVTLDHFEKTNHSSKDGHANIFLSIKREAGSNVIDIKRAMMAEVERVNRDVLQPAGLQIELVADDVRYVQASIRNVWQNLFIGSVLAIGVMYLFLRSAKVTAIGVMGIPVCIIVAFLGLLVSGRTINVISLAGIAFAIGMTLDNSIVVLESIALEKRKGVNGFTAAVQGVSKVWPAVLASSLTTVLVFIPVAFVELEAGQLYSDIAIAVSAAILASMLVAITVLPTAAARLNLADQALLAELSADDGPARRGNFGGRLQAKTQRAVNALLLSRKRRWSCIAAVVVASITIIVTLTPSAEYLPEGEEPKVFATMNAPPGYSLNAMQSIVDDLNEKLMPVLDARPGDYQQGLIPVPALAYFNMRVMPGALFVITEPQDPADANTLLDAISQLFQQYPGMRAFAARGSIITSNDGGTRSINLDISGSSLDEIYRVALAAYRRAGEVFDNPRIRSNPGSLTLAQPLFEIRPNWQRAAELGLTADDLGFTVSAFTDGSYVDEFFLDDDKIDIYLYSQAGQNANLDSLAQLPVYTNQGAVLPLAALAELRERVDTSALRRVNGSRTVSLNIIPPPSVALENGVEIVREQVIKSLRQQGEIPAGVNVSISGAADQLDATRDALWSNYLVALVIIYLLLVAIFAHWGYPLLILTAIPLGVAGGILGLWLLNIMGAALPWFGMAAFSQSFDMISMLGFLILMGTVVNNPILIVHRAIENLTTGNMLEREAVQEAVEARLRPIAMSTITTIFGLLPLVLIPGAGTELYRGVGAIVLFGIIGAAIVSLTLLPALTVEALTILRGRKNTHSSL